MNQKSQTNLLLGIGAITAAVIVGYFGLDHFSNKKTAVSKAATAETSSETAGDYSAAIAAATANVAGGSALTAEDAARIGEEVARQVAAQVAQSIVDQNRTSGGSAGLTEEDARRIGEEEGRRVAQEVAAATIQEALAANGGGGGSGLSVAEAEQIGAAAGRRAAQQVAASTARDVVRNEFGGSVAAAATETPATTSDSPTAEPVAVAAQQSAVATVSTASSAGADALKAWWTTPASGDFGLMYAGQPKGEGAIALLFSEQPADSTLNQNVKVYDAMGALVSGNWEAAANPRLAVLRGLQPGRYTVVVEPALANASGKAVNKAQHGPIYVI